MRTIVVPGIGGSGPDHWQSHWERSRPDLVRFAPTSWDEPDLDDWLLALDRASDGNASLLIAHSLGCLAAVAWARRHRTLAAGLLLVAPPDPEGPAFPDAAASFRAIDLDGSLQTPTLVVASTDDPYASPARSASFAAAIGAGWIDVGPHGHLNAESGLGAWSHGRELLEAFSAGARLPG
ncbi:RBBP9/YdeN family alpha/beta hydrolase [Microbacterium gilvum]|uniref:Alpha/beta hydrolase n=1 Tax=Microbacterium gilvum TaxID=1336204 RepID=A0ABP9A620_9MICO